MDIGTLDRAVQVCAPYSCSSMVQRMGRFCRIDGKQKMVLFCNDDNAEWRPEVEELPLELARDIAEIELYLGGGTKLNRRRRTCCPTDCCFTRLWPF